MYSLFERRWPYECYQININVDFIHLWTHRNASSTSATACFRSSRSRRRMRIEEYKESNPTNRLKERAKPCLFHCKWDSQSSRTRCHLHDVDGELLKQSENPNVVWFRDSGNRVSNSYLTNRDSILILNWSALDLDTDLSLRIIGVLTRNLLEFQKKCILKRTDIVVFHNNLFNL